MANSALFSLEDSNLSNKHKNDDFPFQFNPAFETNIKNFWLVEQLKLINSVFEKISSVKDLPSFKTENLFLLKKVENKRGP